jgi:glycosyltransferase involved in cell wall biosynthesis
MCKGFLERGWKVTVLTLATNTVRDGLDWEGAELVEFGYGGTFHRPLVIMGKGWDGDYAAFLLSREWDVVIFHAYEAVLMAALPILGQVSGSKIIVSHGYGALIWDRNPRFPYGLVSVGRRFLRSLAMIGWMRRFDRIVYLSEQADFRGFYDHLIAKAIGYKGRRVIPNGIDPDRRGIPASGFREKHGIPAGAFLLLCVANYSPRKDQGYACRAFRKAAIPGSVLVFIGSDFNQFSRGFQERDFVASDPSAPGKVIWLEKQDRQSTLDAFAACDTFILSANHEAQPISLLEAMRESKPWIARKAGCIHLMEGGICVKSEVRMAAAIQRLAEDVELRERLGKEGSSAVATSYNRDAYIAAYQNLVEELVAPAP